MSDVKRKLTRQKWRIKALSYALIYVVLSGLWILFSGKALELFVAFAGLAEMRANLEIYKGWLFVLLTGLAFYALLHSWQQELPDPAKLHASDDDDRYKKSLVKLPVLYLLGLLLIVASGGYVAFEQMKSNELQKIEQNLSAVASLKVAQIDGWLGQNIDFAAAAGNGSYLADSFERWKRDGKLSAERMQWVRTRLTTLRQSYPYGDISLHRLDGEYFLTTDTFKYDVAEHARGLFQQAAASKRPAIGTMHWHDRPDGSRHVSLPMAAPLIPGGQGGEVAGMLMFELNPEKFLLPVIEFWPTPSQSAETVLVQRDGNDVLFLNKLRHKKDVSLFRMAIGPNPKLLAAQAMNGRLGALTGVDYRGIPVVGYAKKIPHTDWVMIAKIDLEEIEQPIRQIAFNVTLTAFVLALIGSVSLYFWWRQRRVKYETAQITARLQQKMLERQLDFLSKYANDIILLFDENGNIVDANDRAEIAYQRMCSELIGLNVREFRKKDELEVLGEQWQQMKQRGSLVFEGTHLRRDGSAFPVEVSSRLIEAEQGIFVQSIVRDISERKRAEEDLRMAATVFESSHSSIMITDNQAHIIAVNPAFTGMTGYSEQEVIGKNPSFLKSGRQDADFYRDFWRDLSQDGHWQGEMWNCRKNGEEYATWLSISALRDEDGIVAQYIGISDDITAAKESQSRIEFLAYHDALTGLPNRMLANDRLLQSIARAHRLKTRLAVMFLDLDDFKTINDTLGHSTGDLMLRAVADRLRESVRESDTVSRQGGDEFLVMLNDVSDLDAINGIAVGILEKINRPYLIEEHELSTSTSIGIAIYPEDGQDCDTLLKNADMAMYNAKQSGRNTHRFFAEDMNDYVLEHLMIRNGLMRALENREFQLHYQPQLELNSGRLVGAEALIRWQHPELGMVPPNRFIQVAEESGMIVPIGEWVLREACQQAMAWRQSGWAEMVVSVNISAVQFRRGDLEQVVSTALAESGLAPQFLELELTESILIQDVEKSLDIIQRLKDLGVRLSIDDFGTGYSSLAYLRQLPVDKLKIDQSFVREIITRQDDAAIALSIITLAHTLHKCVIAEGVETVEQLRFLQQHGCDEIQGYLYSRPLAPEGFAEFLQNGAGLDSLHQD